MSVTIETGQFEPFFAAPFAAYGAGSPYVAPLKSDLAKWLSDKNPLFRGASELAYFTAHRDGKLLGRITAHVHAESNAKFVESRACFGFFDCADDSEAASALLTRAEDWARVRGFDRIAGNFNLTAMQQIGIVTDGFEHPPYLDQMWNAPHIPRLLKANGYSATFPMTTFELDLAAREIPPLGEKQRAIADDPRFAFIPITRRNLEARLDDVRVILNASFADNPMFVPLTKEEFDFQVGGLKLILDPRLSAIVHRDGAPAACVVAVPDVNPLLRRVGSRMGLHAVWPFLKHRFTNDRAVAIIAGVIPEYQNTGVAPVLIQQILLNMKTAGYRTMGNTWIHDDNVKSLAQPRRMGAEPRHRLHLFEKRL